MNAKRKRSAKIWSLVRLIVLLIVIIAALAGGVFWGKGLVLSRQVQFVSSQEGTLETPVEVDALVANTEHVVTTSTAGKLDKYLSQGDRVRKGSAVAKIIAQNSGGKIELSSPISGLVNYNIDGQEGIVTVTNLLEWDLDKFAGINVPPASVETFQSGQAVFKITDNLIPTYLFFKVPQAEVKLTQGDSIALQIDQQRVSGKIVRLNKQGPQGGVVVALNSFLSQSLGKRNLKLNWLDKPVKGQIVPIAALIDREGVRGVYIIKNGVVGWQPVKVNAQSNDKLCIDGLKNSTRVITTPGYVHEGQILN
jgi:putative membrane fusion protein